MPRIRWVKPDLFQSESVARMPVAARYSFIGLLCQADDEGRFRDSPRVLNGMIWSLDDDHTSLHMEADLDAMQRESMICRYSGPDGTKYLHVPKFREHQHVNRPTPSRNPGCPLHDGQSGPVKASESGQLLMVEVTEKVSSPDPEPSAGGLGGPVDGSTARVRGVPSGAVRALSGVGLRGPSGAAGRPSVSTHGVLTEGSLAPSVGVLRPAPDCVCKGDPCIHSGGVCNAPPYVPVLSRFTLVRGGLTEDSLRTHVRKGKQGKEEEVEVEVEKDRPNTPGPLAGAPPTTPTATPNPQPAAPPPAQVDPTTDSDTDDHDQQTTAPDPTGTPTRTGRAQTAENDKDRARAQKDDNDMGIYDGPPEDPFESISPGTKKSRGYRPDPVYVDAATRLVGFFSARLTATDTRHNPTSRWTEAAEQLLRIDERPESEILAVMEWVTQDSFWMSNCQSVVTLRTKYEKLRKDHRYGTWLRANQRRLAAEAAAAGRDPAPTPVPGTNGSAAPRGRIVDRPRNPADYDLPL